MPSRIYEGYINVNKVKGRYGKDYIYYAATIKILNKTTRKTFEYSDVGHLKAEIWLRDFIKSS